MTSYDFGTDFFAFVQIDSCLPTAQDPSYSGRGHFPQQSSKRLTSEQAITDYISAIIPVENLTADYVITDDGDRKKVFRTGKYNGRHFTVYVQRYNIPAAGATGYSITHGYSDAMTADQIAALDAVDLTEIESVDDRAANDIPTGIECDRCRREIVQDGGSVGAPRANFLCGCDGGPTPGMLRRGQDAAGFGDPYLPGVTCNRCSGPVLSDPDQHRVILPGVYWCGECLSIEEEAQRYPNLNRDDDPRCVCGVYRSEHALCGCPDGFQLPGGPSPVMSSAEADDYADYLAECEDDHDDEPDVDDGVYDTGEPYPPSDSYVYLS